MSNHRSYLGLAWFLLAAAVSGSAAARAALEIAHVKHAGPVDFQKEILPVLRRNCLACHNGSRAENDLVLETPQTIIKGGADGPAVVPGKSGDSRLLKLAAHQAAPAMPPPDNKSGAQNLTPQELGLIRLWIDQGAKGEVLAASGQIAWQPLPRGLQPIYAVALSPDGQIAAAGRANQIRLYHVATKRELSRLTDPSLLQRGLYEKPGVAHLDLVQSLAFSADGETLASGAFREVKLWRRVRNARKAELSGLDGVAQSLAVSRDGKWAAVGQENGKIGLFELATAKAARMLVGHTAAVTGIAFSTDGSRLVSGSQDKWFRVWNVADGNQVGGLATPQPIAAVAWVNNDQALATAGQDNLIRVWPCSGAAKPLAELAGHSGPVTALAAVAGNSTQLVSGSQDGTLRIWDLKAGNLVRQWSHGAPVTSVVVRGDGQRMASLGVGNTIRLWNAATGQPAGELKGNFRAKAKADEAARAATWARLAAEACQRNLEDCRKRKQGEIDNSPKPDDKKPEESKRNSERAAQLIRAATEAVTQAEAAAQAAGARGKQAEAAAAAAAKAAADSEKPWAAIAFSADGATLAGVGADQTVFTWDAESGVPLDAFAGSGPTLPVVAFDTAHDPVTVVNGTLVVWNAHAGWRLERTLGTPDSGEALVDRVTALAFSRDGKRLATGSGEPSRSGQLKIWDAESGALIRELREPHSDSILAAEFSHDDRLLATAAADRFMKVFEVDTGKQVRSFEGHTHQVMGVSWSADDRTLVTGGADKVLKVWDFLTGDQRRTIAGFGKEVTAVRFVAETPHVVASCGDHGVHLRHADTGAGVRTYGGAGDFVFAVAVSSDGRTLVAGGQDGVLRIWAEAGPLLASFGSD